MKSVSKNEDISEDEMAYLLGDLLFINIQQFNCLSMNRILSERIRIRLSSSFTR